MPPEKRQSQCIAGARLWAAEKLGKKRGVFFRLAHAVQAFQILNPLGMLEALFRQEVAVAEHGDEALEAGSGKPVGAIAGTFTQQPGVPLVIAEVSCDGEEQRLRLRMERLGLREPNAAPPRWQVPVTLAVGLAPATASATRRT